MTNFAWGFKEVKALARKRRPVSQSLWGKKENILGLDHADTSKVLQILSWVMKDAEKLDEARKLGSNHPDTIKSREVLATSLFFQGNYSRSTKAYQDSVNTYRALWVL